MKHAKWCMATALAALSTVGQPVQAQDEATYPTKPIQMIVAYPPGGGTDILARVVGAELSKTLGQPIVVVNRGGASGAIGTESAARAAPDGYTLLMATANVTISPAVDAKTRVNPTKDFVPVTLLSESPFVLVASSTLEARSFAELLAYSKTHPSAVNYASTGIGSPQQLVTELLKKKVGLDWTHVPYQGGGPAMADLMAGQVQVMFSNVLPVLPYIKNGRVRALAVTTQEPLPALSNVPTMIQAGQPGFVVSFWSGVLAPAGTSPAIVAKLNGALMKIMQLPAVRDRLAREGSIVTPLPSAKFAEYLADDAARWQQIAVAERYFRQWRSQFPPISGSQPSCLPLALSLADRTEHRSEVAADAQRAWRKRIQSVARDLADSRVRIQPIPLPARRENVDGIQNQAVEAVWELISV